MKHREAIKKELLRFANPAKAVHLRRYFKAVPGGYGEGDLFLGVSVPVQRKIARQHCRDIPLEEVEALLRDPQHECRLTALFILCLRFERNEAEREAIAALYRRNLAYVNNWDLVDSSAGPILGAYLWGKDREPLFELAASGELWKQRIAVMATFHFIKQGRFEETLALAELFLNHPHDLIHKAVGWMLREIGKRDFPVAFDFLKRHCRAMPRTMLRYAIEKYPPDLRQRLLQGLV